MRGPPSSVKSFRFDTLSRKGRGGFDDKLFKGEKMKKILAVMFVLVFLAGCGSEGGKEVANVNGKKITMQQLNDEIDSLPGQYKFMANDPEMRRRIVDNLVITELLIQHAKNEGILDKPEVKKQIKEQEMGIKAEVEAQMYSLKKQKVNASKIAIREVVIKELLNVKEYKGVTVSDKEVKVSYDQYAANAKKQNPDAKVEKFADVKEEIKSSLARQKWIENLKTGANIVVNESAIGQPAPFGGPGSQIQIQPQGEQK